LLRRLRSAARPLEAVSRGERSIMTSKAQLIAVTQENASKVERRIVSNVAIRVAGLDAAEAECLEYPLLAAALSVLTQRCG
jgi:hypothetical protein